MPIQHAIWKVGSQPTPLSLGKLASEQSTTPKWRHTGERLERHFPHWNR